MIYDELDQTRSVILFAFPPRSRGRINQISWFILMMMHGIPTPACWLVEVEREHLACRWPEVDWPATLICFVAQTPQGRSPMSTRSKKNPVLTADLNTWPYLASGIALHELAGNFRKMAVARAGVGNYVLYDGAGTFGGEAWHAQLLKSFHNPTNPLASLAGWCDDVARVIPRYAHHVMRAAPPELKKMNELEFYLNGMLPRDCAHTATQFLRNRTTLRQSRWNLRMPSNS